MAVQSSHTGMLHMLPNNSKISFSANIGTEVSLLTFDQLFMPLFHKNHEYILVR